VPAVGIVGNVGPSTDRHRLRPSSVNKWYPTGSLAIYHPYAHFIIPHNGRLHPIIAILVALRFDGGARCSPCARSCWIHGNQRLNEISCNRGLITDGDFKPGTHPALGPLMFTAGNVS